MLASIKKRKTKNKETFWKIMLESNKESSGEPPIQQELIEKKIK